MWIFFIYLILLACILDVRDRIHYWDNIFQTRNYFLVENGGIFLLITKRLIDVAPWNPQRIQLDCRQETELSCKTEKKCEWTKIKIRHLLGSAQHIYVMANISKFPVHHKTSSWSYPFLSYQCFWALPSLSLSFFHCSKQFVCHVQAWWMAIFIKIYLKLSWNKWMALKLLIFNKECATTLSNPYAVMCLKSIQCIHVKWTKVQLLSIPEFLCTLCWVHYLISWTVARVLSPHKLSPRYQVNAMETSGRERERERSRSRVVRLVLFSFLKNQILLPRW